MDKLREQTDRRLARIEREVQRTYKEATVEISESWSKFMKESERVVAEKHDALALALKSGNQEEIKAAQKAYKDACIKQTMGNRYYKDMVNVTADKLAHANAIALDYVNGQMPMIYQYNYNGTARLILNDCGEYGIKGISFDMVDEATVKKLMLENKSLLPVKKMDIAKDMAWNRKAINSQVLQGIVQGESVDKIAARLQNVTDMNESAAIRNARTMTTNAENAGRVDSMREAEELGLEYEKQWMSTHDERTRESHAMIDGESVPLDEKFSNGLEWAGDPSGDPSEVYNCRCSVVRKLVGYKGKPLHTKGYDPDYF